MNRYKAEMWDNMQHIMERYNDHMTHSHFEFDVHLDFENLKKAIEIAVNKSPVLKSKFHKNLLKSEWREDADFSIDDVVKLVSAPSEKALEVSEAFLVKKIDECKEIQIRVLLVRHENGDMLNFLKNHMVMDGADIKCFVYYIARVYSDLEKGGSGNLPFKSGRRDEGQLYKDFSPEEKERVEKLISYSKKQKDRIQFPYEASGKESRTPSIERLVVDADTFLKLKARGKELGYTVNDLIVACFYRATYKVSTIEQGQSLGVPCMIDLRKYIKDGQSEGLTNLTSMIVCHIGEDIGADIFETLAKVKKSMDELKKNYPGLHGIPLLRKVFKYAPFSLAKFLIGTFFKNPLMGISNIGIVRPEDLMFNGVSPTYQYMTGSIKYPPYIQLALTTYKNEITFTIASYMTDNDRKKVGEFFEAYLNEIRTFIA